MVREAKTSLTSAGYTRRMFVKGAATAAAAASAGTLAGCAPNRVGESEDLSATGQSVAEVSEEVYTSYCRSYCSNMCPIEVHCRDGKFCYSKQHAMPEPEYDRICLRGLSHAFRHESKARVLKPLKRSGERGSGQWQEISWDEALDGIAEAWNNIIDNYGHEAMAAYSMTGNFSSLNGWGWGSMNSRFVKAMGMTQLAHANDAAAFFAMERMVGNSYFKTSNEPTDWKNSKLMICWGSNPAVSQMQNFHFITEAQEAGMKFIVIDPIFTATAAVADEFVSVRPGSDGALALGMMNVIVEKGWQDDEFLRQSSVAPFLVKESDRKFLRRSDLGQAEPGSKEDEIVVADGKGIFDVPSAVADPMMEGTFEANGITVTTAYSLLLDRIAEYPVEKASELTGIDAQTIIHLAEEYATDKPGAIYTFFGCDHYYNGHWSQACITALAILTGNMGKKGAWCGIPEFTGADCFNLAYAADVPCPVEQPSSVFITKMEEPVLHGTYNGSPREIRGLFVSCANPVGNVGNRENTLKWMDGLDLLVVVDVIMSETAKYADYVLPAAYWFEVEDIMGLSTNDPFCAYGDAIFEPEGESKSDFEIFKLLAEKMGVGQYFQMTEGEYIENLLDTDKAREYGISYERLKEENYVRIAPKDWIYAEDGVFNTATGRAQFYVEDPQPSNDDPTLWDFEKEYLPYWEPPLEVWGGSEAKPEFPLQLITGRNRHRTHTQWFDAGPMQELDREPKASLNSTVAEEYGIAEGDKVRIYNERGSVVMLATVVENMPDGVIGITKGYTDEQFIEGHASNLTPNRMNPFCGNTPYNDCAVAIEKL